MGRAEEAISLLTEAIGIYRSIGAVLVLPAYLTWLADAFRRAGRPTDGLKQLDEAARQIEATQERWTESQLHRVRGELLIAVVSEASPQTDESCRMPCT
jgi:hypothetical protein